MLRTRDEAQQGACVASAFLTAASSPSPACGSASASSAESTATANGPALFSPHPHLVPEDSDACKIHLQTKFQGQISEFQGQKSEPFKTGRPPQLLLFLMNHVLQDVKSRAGLKNSSWSCRVRSWTINPVVTDSPGSTVGQAIVSLTTRCFFK